MRRASILLSGLLASTSPLLAMASSATLVGRVQDERSQPIAGARVVLGNPLSNYRLVVVTDAQGIFTIPNVPFHEYHLEVSALGMVEYQQNLELHSSLPRKLEIVLKVLGATVEVIDSTRLVEEHPSTHLDIDKTLIESSPAAIQSRAMESILLTTPGFIPDENGRFHFRGSHGQATYVIDGIPVSDQLHATFSNSLDPAQVESMEVITGGINAEYGGKPVAVINMTTKSGLGTPGGFEGEVSLGASRFQTWEMGLTARGGTDRFGYFLDGAGSRSDRFLDPVNFENLHNTGSTGRLFSRFDWVLSDQDTLRFSASGGRTDRDVVNLASQQAAGQNQQVSTVDANVNLSWSHFFDGNRSLDAAAYFRHATANLKPTADLQPGFAAGGPDLPVWAKQERTLDNEGALISYTQRFDGESSMKAGLQYVAFPIQEHFHFAITEDGMIADPADPMYTYTPAGGGHILDFEDRIKPVLASAFVQSDLHLGRWLLALGLRYDRYTLRDQSDDLLQPRVGVSYRFSSGTVLRASYDRLLVTRENENLALSTSQQAWDLGPHAGTPVPPLRPEIQNSFNYGVEQQMGKRVRLMADYWEKRSTNAGDNEQFFNTGVLFPIAADRGLFRGMDVRLDLLPLHGFSGYLSLGKTRAIFQAPTVGGLQLEAPGAAPGERFLIDHDQKLSAQLGLHYERQPFFIQAVGRYDSGLVAGDPAGALGNPDLAFGIPYVRQDSEGTWRVKPRTLWDFSTGTQFSAGKGRTLVLSADLLNAFNEKGLYNFLSTFGGTHVVPPRTWAIHVKYRF